MKAKEVACALLKIANENDSEVSNMKLQKLLYYAQGFHLAIYDKPFFEDNIEAWAHGPVVPEVYHNYKSFGSTPIAEECPQVTLSDCQRELLEEIHEIFGQFSAWKLRDMTHEEQPWLKNESKAGKISHLELKEYFKTRLL